MAKKPAASFEEQLIAATRINPPAPGKDRQPYLKRVIGYIEQLSDAKWEELSEAIQKWFNAAIKDRDAERDIREVPGFVEATSEDEEEEAPAPKKKRAAAEEEEEEPAPKKKRAAAADEEEEEPRPKKKAAKETEDEEEDAPAPKKKSARKADEEDAEADEAGEPEQDEEDSTMAKKKKVAAGAAKKKTAAPAPAKKKVVSSGGGAPVVIIGMLVKDPGLSRDDLIIKLKAKGIEVSDTTVTTQRQNFRTAVRALHGAGVFSKEFGNKVAENL